ncbi:unnamed protein product [marine sediment metagenome]|uniref:ABC transmembrane type-1 domain-containing protein n=1 Tax=marine sediment metagenome TaxID=412755 RepID=X1ID90_9ZZZZ
MGRGPAEVCQSLQGVEESSFINNGDYRVIVKATSKGIVTTLYVSFIAYLMATLSVLVWGLMRVSTIRALREISTVYVEIIRGIPMLVILYYIAFVGAPALANEFVAI